MDVAFDDLDLVLELAANLLGVVVRAGTGLVVVVGSTTLDFSLVVVGFLTLILRIQVGVLTSLDGVAVGVGVNLLVVRVGVSTGGLVVVVCLGAGTA